MGCRRYVLWSLIALNAVLILVLLTETDIFTSRILSSDSLETAEASLVTSRDFVDSQTFQAADHDSLYLYSAYLDKPVIRVLGLKLQTYHSDLKCQLHLDNAPHHNGGKTVSVDGKLDTIPEHHGMKYTACYVLCRLPLSLNVSSLLAVTILSPSTNRTHNAATLRINRKRKRASSFTLCVAPFHNEYDKAHSLVEMIEFNRILGADKFVFYNYSTGPNVKRVLDKYRRIKVAEIVDWPLPVERKDIHYIGQLLAINDCVYRNRGFSDHVVIQDMDEFIIPGGAFLNWSEIVEHRKRVNPEFTVHQFRNVFFRTDWARRKDIYPYSFQDDAFVYKSVVLTTVYKEDEIYWYDERSKCIVDPMGVETVGIHNIWKSLGQVDRVPSDVALLHHYRNRGNPKDARKRLYDENVLEKYGVKLISAIKDVAFKMNITYETDLVTV